jgi:hypothetical protein
VKRWLILTLGVGFAAAAVYALATLPSNSSDKTEHDEIDDASRARLQRVLEEAEGGSQQ